MSNSSYEDHKEIGQKGDMFLAPVKDYPEKLISQNLKHINQLSYDFDKILGTRRQQDALIDKNKVDENTINRIKTHNNLSNKNLLHNVEELKNGKRRSIDDSSLDKFGKDYQIIKK